MENIKLIGIGSSASNLCKSLVETGVVEKENTITIESEHNDKVIDFNNISVCYKSLDNGLVQMFYSLKVSSK